MRLMVRAVEGVWLLAGSQLSKTAKGGAPQATEIKSYDRLGHPPCDFLADSPLAERPKLLAAG